MADEEKAAEGTEAETEEAVQKKEKAPEGAAPPNQKLVLLVLLMNAVVLIALAVIVWIGMSKRSNQVTLGDIAAEKEKPPAAEKGGEGGEKGKEGKKGEGEGESDRFIKESFTVNLADPRGSHFAKVDVEIEVDDDFVREEIQKKLKPKIRDFILVILSSKTYEQIESVDGRDFLREEIRNKINGYLSRGKIKNVFFTQFIVQ